MIWETKRRDRSPSILFIEEDRGHNIYRVETMETSRALIDARTKIPARSRRGR
jgi:hypothetical protein